MVTVREPVGDVARIWGEGKPQKTEEYRLIRYLLRQEADGKTVLCHTVTGEVAELGDAEADLLGTLPGAYREEMDDLIAHRFLVPADFDEHREVLSLRRAIKLFQKAKPTSSYVILPTTGCNARCFYCFEAGTEVVTMTPEAADKTADYILSHLPEDKKVHILWFGGEPTVASRRIDRICRKLTENGVELASEMISNAYLFDEEMADRARDLWKLYRIQITLDGTEETYNRVKAYVNPTDNPYRRVLRNISLLLDRGVHVSLRMNLDRYNFEEIKALIAELKEHFSGNPLFGAYAFPLNDNCGWTSHTEEDIVWQDEKVIELGELIDQAGLSIRGEKFTPPALRVNGCMADSGTSVGINPKGELVLCMEKFEKDAVVGTIEDGVTDPGNLRAWSETFEYPECAECAHYPRCVRLKKCPGTIRCRESWKKKYYDKFLVVYYRKWRLEQTTTHSVTNTQEKEN